MNDLESQIRAALHGREGDAPEFDLSDARDVAGRTRRRQILNATGAGIGALAVVVALTAGIGGLVRADRTPTPLDTPSSSPSPAPVVPTFSSALHEITVGYPAGWVVRPAIEPWSGGRLTFDASDVDVIFDPALGDDVYLVLVSEPLGGLSKEEWVRDDPWRPGICAETEGAGAGSIYFGGAKRYWSVSCSGGGSSSASGHYLRVATDTRGYLVYLHVAGLRGTDEPPYDVDFFNGLLETLRLEYQDLRSITSPDGEVTFSAPSTWEDMLWPGEAAAENAPDVWFGVLWPGPEIGDDVESIGLVDPVAYDAWCGANGGSPLLSAPADAAAIAQKVVADPNFETTTPVATRVGGFEALSIDAELAPGGTDCGVYMIHIARWIHSLVDRDMRLRLYLVDLPEGMSVRTLAITVAAPKERFERFLDDATPVIESIEFHP
jgi:hypothetical protein